MKISGLFTAVAASLGVASANQLADDPPAYFGGVNNEAYLVWLKDNQIESRYSNSVYMPSIDQGLGAAVHWSADEEYIHVAVAARASGWLGFGLSDAGGMLGSDMALFSLNRPNEIVDAHVVETFFPKEDDCQRDWVYVNSSAASVPVSVERAETLPEAVAADLSDEFIMFETRRKLITNDPQDFPIARDNTTIVPEQRIIAAWGDTPDVSFHGTNRARGSIRVFKKEVDEPDFDETMAKHADGSFFVGAKNYEVPSNETTYVDFCVSRSDLIAQGVPDTTDLMSIIGFNPIVEEASAAFVHHYIVTGKFNASDGTCGDGPGFDMVFVWAPGDGGFALPEFLGSNLFGEDGFQAFNVEIHYDNPRFVEGHIDNSGVEIFYTTTPRSVEMGVMQVGDPFISLYGEAVGAGLSGHHFECPGGCSDAFLSDGEPVTVIREYLHMHVSGTRTVNEHIRDGGVIRSASTEVWDFNANGNVPVKQQSYEVYPGDGFRMSCYFRGDEDTVYGLGSREEMCIAFLYYYPRKSYFLETPDANYTLPWVCGHGVDWLGDACDATYEPEGILESEESMHRLFGKQPENCLVSSDATVENPAVVLEPPVEVTPPAPAEGVSLQTETETASGPAPENESAPSLRVTPAPTPETVSGAATVCIGGTVSIAMLAAFLV